MFKRRLRVCVTTNDDTDTIQKTTNYAASTRFYSSKPVVEPYADVKVRIQEAVTFIQNSKYLYPNITESGLELGSPRFLPAVTKPTWG